MTSHQDPQTLAVRQDVVEAAAAAAINNNDWGRFLSLHESVRVELLAYLSINDLTNLSMVSHQFRDTVSSVRTTYPHIIWEERLPTQIGCQPYETSHSNYYPGDSDDEDAFVAIVASVAQLQNFRFIVRITAQISVQIEYSLINGIWDEFENDQVLGLLFYANPPGCHRDDEDCEDNDWTVLGENGREFTPGDARNLTPLEMDNLRSVMVMLWMCVKRIAAYPDKTVYPSAEYLMSKLPTWLHQYFPVPITQDHFDRNCVVEFDYRPAPAMWKWIEFVDSEFSNQCSLQSGIPWYENEEEVNSESSEDDE